MDKSLRIQVLLQAVDKLTRPLRDVVAGAKGVNKEIGETRKRLKDLQRAGDEVRAFRGLAQDLRRTDAEMAAAQQKVDGLARKLRDVEKPTRAMSAEFRRAQADSRALKQRHQEQSAELERLRRRLGEAGASTHRLGSYERELRGEISRTNAELKEQEARAEKLAAHQARLAQARKLKGRLQNAAGALAGGGATSTVAGAGVLAPEIASIRAAMSFESAMADVKKVVNFDTPRQFKQMGEDLIALSREVPVTATGLAQITAEAARFGVARQDLIAFTRDAAKMKVAFDFEDDSAAGHTMAVWRNAFGFRQAQVEALADQINALTNKSGGKASDVSDVVTRVGPLAKVAGMGAAQTAALAQTLVSMGVESEIASTGIKNLLLRLEAGEAATPKQRKAFKALGFDAVQMAKMMQADPSKAIVSILGKLKGLDKYRQSAILTQLVGRESIEPIASLATNLDRVQDALTTVGDKSKYGGSMEKEFANRLGTSANAVELSRAGVMGLAIQLGEYLLPDVVAISKWVSKATGNLSAFAKAHPGVTTAAARFAAVLGVLLLVGGGVALAIAGILGPLALAHVAWVQATPVLQGFGAVLRGLPAGIFGVARAFAAMGAGLLANPVFWIVAAIVAALVGAVLVIRKYWQPISAFFGGVFAGFAAAMTPVMEALAPLKPLWDAIVGAIGAAIGWFMKLLEPVKSTKEELAGATEAGRRVGQVLGLVVRALIDPFGTLGALLQALGPSLAALGGRISAGLSAGGQAVLAWLGQLWNRLKAMVGAGLAAIGSQILAFSPLGLLVRVFAAVFPYLSGLAGRFLAAGAHLVSGLVQGILSMGGAVKTAIDGVAGSTVAWFKSKLGIHSPSRVFAAMGGHLMGGLEQGMARSQRRPLARVSAIAAALAAAMGAASLPAVAAAPAAPTIQVTGDRPEDAPPPPPVLPRKPPRPPLPPLPPAPVPAAPAAPAAPLPSPRRAAPPEALRAAAVVRQLVPAPVAPPIVQAGQEPPLQRVRAEAGRVREAIDAGGPARRVEAPSAVAARTQAAAASRPAPAPDHVEIKIYPPAGADPREIARLVEQALEKRDRAKRARRRSDLQDYED